MKIARPFFIIAVIAGIVTSFSCVHFTLPDVSLTEMVYLEGGDFTMGRDGDSDHSPAHRVSVNPFHIDKHEVTNAQYYRFCEETEHRLPEFWGMSAFHCGLKFPDYPVVSVSWGDAKAYAEWAGKRLPTEAEWEYAARGGLDGARYAHGDKLTSADANYWIKDLEKGTTPVGSYPPNGYGLFDMTGNVSEWVSDYYLHDYYAHSPLENPAGPERGKFKVLRGGGWHTGPGCSSVYYRIVLLSGWLDFSVGFRCAKDME